MSRMNLLGLGLCALIATATQHAAAIQQAGAIPQPRLGPAPGEPIERGGTIEGVDPARPAILVDGVPYAVPRGSLRIHLAPNRISTSISDLRRGMKIRFTAVNERGGQQVREIWVTGVKR